MDLESLKPILAQELFGNSVEAYLVAAGVLLGIMVALGVFRGLVVAQLHRWAKKTTTDIDDFLVKLIGHIGPSVYFFVALYVSTRSLTLPGALNKLIHVLFVVALTLKVVQLANETADYFLSKWSARAKAEDPTSHSVIGNLGKIVHIGVWAAGVVFILDNLGINVTAFVAGLGVGGVAVALAAQAILGDAFSSFAIFMDKPFKVGDFIIVGDLLGTVEHIGFKTTRVRSLGGEQLVFSNSDLTSSRIRNYKRMETRRVVSEVGVIYQTPAEKMQKIPGIIQKIVESHELSKFDRSHFKSFGDFALIFETVYYILSSDYNKYMDVQQYINLKVKEAFEKEGIEFAYPTQLVYHSQTQAP